MKQLKVISVEKRYRTDGHAPYLVISDNFERYVLKTPKNVHDKASIQREVICHFLLKSFEIPNPNISFLKIEDEKLKHIIKNSDCLNLHFASKHIRESIDFQELFTLSEKYSKNRIVNLQDIFKIAYFDIWTSNTDRKPSNQNLLFCPSAQGLELTAIDHAATFDSIAFDDLNPKWGENFSFNDSILHTKLVKSIVPRKKDLKNWKENFIDKAYLCIKDAKFNINDTLNKLPKELRLTVKETDCLKKYLFDENRIKKVNELFICIVHDITS